MSTTKAGASRLVPDKRFMVLMGRDRNSGTMANPMFEGSRISYKQYKNINSSNLRNPYIRSDTKQKKPTFGQVAQVNQGPLNLRRDSLVSREVSKRRAKQEQESRFTALEEGVSASAMARQIEYLTKQLALLQAKASEDDNESQIHSSVHDMDGAVTPPGRYRSVSPVYRPVSPTYDRFGRIVEKEDEEDPDEIDLTLTTLYKLNNGQPDWKIPKLSYVPMDYSNPESVDLVKAGLQPSQRDLFEERKYRQQVKEERRAAREKAEAAKPPETDVYVSQKKSGQLRSQIRNRNRGAQAPENTVKPKKAEAISQAEAKNGSKKKNQRSQRRMPQAFSQDPPKLENRFDALDQIMEDAHKLKVPVPVPASQQYTVQWPTMKKPANIDAGF
jgi:hypothetical protein